MQEPFIRVATTEDTEALLGIYAHYVQHTAITFEWEVPSLTEFEQRISTTLMRYPYLVAELDGSPVGYAYAGAFKDRRAYDWSAETTIYMREDSKGHGVAGRLYQALEEVLRSQGVCNLYACIACPRAADSHLSMDSAKYHEHMGYRLVGRFESCASKFGIWYDMVWMEKTISAHKPNPSPPIPFPSLDHAILDRIGIEKTSPKNMSRSGRAPL